MALTSKVTLRINATQTGSNDLGNPQFPMAFSQIDNMLDGTAAGQADLLFSDQRTITASSNEDLDLSGSLTDVYGTTLAFVKVKVIAIYAASGNTNNVQVGPAASNGFLGPFADASDQIDIAPGGTMLLTAPSAGWTVTASTGDLLNIANSGAGTGVTYDIVIIGTSA